jgi:hypothetical protein
MLRWAWMWPYLYCRSRVDAAHLPKKSLYAKFAVHLEEKKKQRAVLTAKTALG